MCSGQQVFKEILFRRHCIELYLFYITTFTTWEQARLLLLAAINISVSVVESISKSISLQM